MATIRRLDATLFESVISQCVIPPTAWAISSLGDAVITSVTASVLSAARIKSLKQLERRDRNTWYITVLRLRCFVRGDEDLPVRPHVIIVAEVSPAGHGQILAECLCDPFDQTPSSATILDTFISATARGASASDEKYFPGSVLFDDAELGKRCAASLLALGIRSQMAASPPPGIDLHREDLSKRLVQVSILF